MLMSFIGCVGILMAEADIVKFGFGSVSHLLTGKTFPQNKFAHGDRTATDKSFSNSG